MFVQRGKKARYALTPEGLKETDEYFSQNRCLFSSLGIEIPDGFSGILTDLYTEVVKTKEYTEGTDEHSRITSAVQAFLIFSPAAINRLSILSSALESGIYSAPGQNSLIRRKLSFQEAAAYSDITEKADLTAQNIERYAPYRAGSLPCFPEHLTVRRTSYEIDRGTETLALSSRGDDGYFRSSIEGKALSYLYAYEKARSFGDIVFIASTSMEERGNGRKDRTEAGEAVPSTAAAAAQESLDEGTAAELTVKYADRILSGICGSMDGEGEDGGLLPSYTDPVLTGLSANLYAFLSENDDLIPGDSAEERELSLTDMTHEFLKALPWIREHAFSQGEGDSAFVLSEKAALSYMEDYSRAVISYLSGEGAVDPSAFSFMEHVLRDRRQRQAGERENERKRKRKCVEDALRAFMDECIRASADQENAGDALVCEPGAPAVPASGTVVSSMGGIRIKSRAWGMLNVFRKIMNGRDEDRAKRLRAAFMSGMSVSAVFPSRLWELWFTAPERWAGRRGIVNALSHLGVIPPSGEAPFLSFQTPLLFKARRDGGIGPCFLTRLLLSSPAGGSGGTPRRIAVENVSNDLGGLIRAKEFISGFPPSVLRDTCMVLLINDDLTLADGTDLMSGSLMRDEKGVIPVYKDVDAERGSTSGIVLGDERTVGNPAGELSWYAKAAGTPWTGTAGSYGEGKPSGGSGSSGGSGRPAGEEAFKRAVSFIQHGRGAGDTKRFYILPFLAGLSRDYVFVTYSQFLSAAAGFTEVPFTFIVKGAPACLRVGRIRQDGKALVSDSVIRPYRLPSPGEAMRDYDLSRYFSSEGQQAPGRG